MDQFEYIIHEFDKGKQFYWNDSPQIDELNKLGREGWEVIFIDGSNCLLKRRISIQ